MSLGSSFLHRFAALRDPRQSRQVVDPLPEVLSAVLSGTLAGAENSVQIRRWASLYLGFLLSFPRLANGTASPAV